MSEMQGNDEPFFSMGDHTYKVSMNLNIENRDRTLVEMRKDPKVPKNSIILLQGGTSEAFQKYCTDTDLTTFRQEPYFQWLFGINEPNCYGMLDLNDSKATLFVPKLPDSYLIWMGEIKSLEFYKKRYAVANTHYSQDIEKVIKQRNPSIIYLLKGLNTDSNNYTKEAYFPGIEKFNLDKEKLHPIMAELRVYKTDLEIDLLKYCNKISSKAHKKVMLASKPGTYEYQSESDFLDYSYKEGGMRHVSYTCICGSGHNGSILHYGHAAAPNDKLIKDGDMCLYDMGAEYYGYASDITCSFPANGKFTEKQKFIYNGVLKANRTVLKACKPGVMWPDMHKLAEKVILEELKAGGLLKGDIEGMMKARLGAIFMPHGLGHLMGLDVHDVGGYPKGLKRPEGEGLKNLRTARKVEERMVLTIEPGIYFIDPVLDSALKDPAKSKFMVKEKIDQFRGSGGVRIEDDVVITKDGAELMTDVPRTVEEVEKFMLLRDSNNNIEF